MPFPPLIRWALLGAIVLFGLGYALAWSEKGLGLACMAAAALCALLAVPAALYLLVRRGPYVTWGNVVTTLLAAIPLALAVLVAFVLRFGHFHI